MGDVLCDSPKKNFFPFISHLISLSSKISCSQKQKKLHQLFLSLSRYRDSTSKKYDRNRFFRFFRENVDIKFNLLKIYDSRCHITLVSKICVYKYQFKSQFYSKTFKEKEKSMMQHLKFQKGKINFAGKKSYEPEVSSHFHDFFTYL